MIEKIDHIGIIVKDLDKAIEAYTKGMGIELKHVEESPEFNVKIAFLPIGEVLIELIEPIGPGMAQDFLHTHGEGFHHICYRVSNIVESLEVLGKKFRLRDKEPRKGGGGSMVAFLDPSTTCNVETEIVERKEVFV